MLLSPWTRAAALASLFLAPIFVTGALAQNPPVVMIKAYDAKGKDTGKCMRGPDTLSEGPGGYRLVKCDKKAQNQKLMFDVNVGGWIFQNFGGTPLVMGVYGGAVSDNAYDPGTGVHRVVASNDPGFKPWGVKWRWVGRQIYSLDGAAGAVVFCLTTMPRKGDEIVIDNCANKATLTQWDVLVVK